MTEDRSLDEFFGDDAEQAGSASPDDLEAVDSDDLEAVDSDDLETADIEPAESTSSWRSDGRDCDGCGRRVERRWRDGDSFVCADCKEW